MNLLTIGTEYSGRLNLYGCGITSANKFEQAIKEKIGPKIDTIISLRGNQCSANNIKSSIHKLLSNGNKTIIYYSGHGNHRRVKEKYIEYWDTPSGQLDQISIGNMLNEVSSNSFVILFSESCSSEHMINPIAMKKHYVSIGATMDYQDAMMTCDGGLLAIASIEVFSVISNDCKVKEFVKSLMDKGITVENFSILFSSNHLMDEKMF